MDVSSIDEQQLIQKLVIENERRNRVIFDDFNPVTGKGCPGKRTKVHLEGYPLKAWYMPNRCWRNHLWRKIRQFKSIDEFIIYGLKKEANDYNRIEVTYCISRIRAAEDPAFAMYVFYRIQDKINGGMKPFRLNYPQRLVLEQLEDMRLKGEPIRLVILKARQWGGSTLSQGYEKWMGDFRHTGWNMAILAHVKDATKRIKAMFSKMLDNQPGWSLGAEGEQLKFCPYEGSSNDFIITNLAGDVVRNTVVSVASFENYDALRSGDYKCAHYSETAYWKETPQKVPEEVYASVDGGIPFIPDTVEIFESSGRSATGFFHDLYKEAKDPDIPSTYRAIFIPFFCIENDRIKVEDKVEFAKWLLDNKDSSQCPKGYKESGKFFWSLWQKGATFEAINWYRQKRNSPSMSHAVMATEAPSDDIEAFKMSGKLIFNMYAIEALQDRYMKDPIAVGDIVSDADKGITAINTARFEEGAIEGAGILRVWALPDILKVANRYVVSVDIGGTGQKSDFTVMTVIDRLGMMRGMNGKPKVVARWRGHIRHDLLAWKAAALAHFYGDAKLVIESNTADSEKSKIDTDGEHFYTIIQEIAGVYWNMYVRQTTEDKVTHEVTNVYGYNTNTLTKQQLIDNYIACVDDQMYEEPEKACYDELKIYERKDDGTIGNAPGPGNHDDIVMSTGIGLHVSMFKMPPPEFITVETRSTSYVRERTESSF